MSAIVTAGDLHLAKIEHDYCGETQATTYIWVPGDKTEAEFKADVGEAQRRYDEAREAALTFAGPKPALDGFGTLSLQFRQFADRPDDMTVGELKADHAKAEAEMKAWQERHDAATKSFSQILEGMGYTQFWNHAPELTAEIVWGHRHGQPRVEDVDPMAVDLKGALYVESDLT